MRSKATPNSRQPTPITPLRVLVVAPSFDILGGQSVQAARLISRLRETPSLEVDFLPINPRLPGVLRKLQAIKYLRTVVTSFAYLVSLMIRVPKFDVIHIFSASYLSFVIAPTPAILISKLFRKRVLLNYHSGEAEDHLIRWRSAIQTIKLADEVVVPSEYLVRVFKQFGIAARAINNLIELDNFTFRERLELRPAFLSNRNFEKHYGVDRVLRAFALIQQQSPDARLTVAGEGSQRAALEQLAVDLGLRNTKFIGRIEQDAIVAEYEQADVYLNGSEIDNQPLSILEAFACGLPVVTTDAGGIPDMVRNRETGFVVSRGDVEAMAERAMCLLNGPRLANLIARRALAECRNYSWEAVDQKWLAAYQQLGKPAHARRRVGKIHSMTLAEIGTRTSQLLNAFAERQGWSRDISLPDDQTFIKLLQPDHRRNQLDELHKHFQYRESPAFVAGFTDRQATINELNRRWPQTAAEVIKRADRILDGRFDLLGFKDLSFGDPINWHLEPVAGKVAPQIHWSRIEFLDPEIAGDKKITWELNRHQYFLTLGQAYWLTGEEKYAQAFVAHVESWIDQNPPKIGINWASSLEIAFRSISWLWALHFFKESPALSPQTLARMLKVLYLNGRHVQTYLSTYFSPNTHLTGEALGLYYLGTLLPEFEAAEDWRTTGRRVLTEQLACQVKADGVYFEQASYYHRYTADFYTHFLILARNNRDLISDEVELKLTALLDHLLYITRPDGTTPFFGDDDGGRLLPVDFRAANDFRAALSNGAALLSRGDYKFVANELAEETLWLLGPQGARDFDQIDAAIPSTQSKVFPDGGYFVMRDSWDAKANYLLFDCGPHGAGNCGHAHADALSIELAVNGQTLLVDPGTHTYTASKEKRDWFRSSAAHNVLTVDDESSSLPAGPFSWDATARCEPVSWITEKRFDFVEGRHDGYERLADPVTQSRSVLFLKNDYWLLRDRVTSGGVHNFDLRFHFESNSNLQVAASDDGFAAAEQTRQNAGLQILAFGPEGRWRREDGWVSHCYGERAVAPVGVFSAIFRGNDDLLTLLLPDSGQNRPVAEVRQVEAIGGRALEITSQTHSDLVMVRGRNEARMETVRLASDFEWTWARFSRTATGAPEELMELVVLDGQTLALDGKEILKSTRPLRYLVATRAGERFRLETDEGVLDLSLPATDLASVFAEVNRQFLSVPTGSKK